MTISSRRVFSVNQAVENSSTLAQLSRLLQESSNRLQTIKPIIPPALHSHIKAGPLDEKSWCLVVNSSATATKVKQLLPNIEACLRTEGWPALTIRLKIAATS